MNRSESIKNGNSIILGLKTGFPLFLGYFPAAVAFGLAAGFAGFTTGEGAMMSLIVFAGASQFMTVSLVAASAGMIEIVAAVFLLNFRHFLMSASLVPKLKPSRGLWLLQAFGVTDESFSVLSFTEHELTPSFVVAVEFIAYFGWVLGTITGLLAGDVIPGRLQLSLGIVLYALFVVLLLPEVRIDFRYGLIALFAGGIHTLLNWLAFLSAGWNIVIAIALGAVLGAFIFFPTEMKGVKDE